jgi:hypothetical protein
MSEAELKLQKIRVILDALESKIGEIRDLFKGTSAKPPIFPEPYSEMLTISDRGNYWEIKPKQFLDSNDFTEVLRIVKQYKGEYVSAGKSSHFRISK